MRKLQKFSLLIFSGLGLLMVAGLAFFFFRSAPQPVPLPPAVSYDEIPKAPAEEAKNAPVKTPDKAPEKVPEKISVLPAEVNLKIPFTSQAPHANWSHPYKEFCEEASVLMAMSYVKNQPILGPDDADAKMLAIKAFEEKKFGFYEDTGAEDTATIIREYYNFERVSVVRDPSARDIKQALAQGKAVIVPLAGREINNPNFQQPGPLYHMLVIKGYTKNGSFITNDPGTRKGADFIYPEATIMNALSDWREYDLDRDQKVILVVG
jgi:hypothetical protein